ncbi:MAG: hypothetical protein HRU70_12720 [Phycisphaeraceae bacterium]|nr:MAG: hypothetical protein HRU70_12720 [Phycisphaeraceae bacterium]
MAVRSRTCRLGAGIAWCVAWAAPSWAVSEADEPVGPPVPPAAATPDARAATTAGRDPVLEQLAGVAEPSASGAGSAAPAAASRGRSTSSNERLGLGRVEVKTEGGSNETAPVGPGYARTLASLAVVVGLAIAAASAARFVARRRGGLVASLGAGGRAPSGILSVLGRYPLARGQTLILLRVDRRVLLVSQTSSGGRLGGGVVLRTLTEITDPAEVASVVAKAEDASGSGESARFDRLIERADRAGRLVPDDPAFGRGIVETVGPGRAPASASSSPAVEDLRRKLAAMRANGGVRAAGGMNVPRAGGGGRA